MTGLRGPRLRDEGVQPCAGGAAPAAPFLHGARGGQVPPLSPGAPRRPEHNPTVDWLLSAWEAAPGTLRAERAEQGRPVPVTPVTGPQGAGLRGAGAGTAVWSPVQELPV